MHDLTMPLPHRLKSLQLVACNLTLRPSSQMVHDCHELLYVLQGRLVKRLPGGRLSAGVAEAILVPAGCEHPSDMPHDGSTLLLVLQWSGPCPASAVVAIGDPSRRLQLILQWLMDASSQDDVAVIRYRQALLDAALAECDMALTARSAVDDPIERARQYLLHRPTANIHHRDLCRIAGLERSRFDQLFRQRFGLPPMSYLRRTRAQLALQLLQTTDWDLAQIAKRVGFHSPSYLSRVCRDTFGSPPGKLRRSDGRVQSAPGNDAQVT